MIQKKEILPRVPLYYSIPMLVVCIVALLILIFLFRIEYPVLLLQPTNVLNVSSCGVLPQNDAYYLLNQTLNVSGLIQLNQGGCLLVNSSNVVIDGNGFNVIGSLGLAFNGLNITGSNVTVTGFNITDISSSILRNGIVSFGNGVTITKNHFSNASESAVYLKGNPPISLSINNQVYNNTFTNSALAVFLHWTNYSNIASNNIQSSNSTSTGIYLLNSYSNYVQNNFVYDTNNSIMMWVSDENVIKDNLIQSPRYSGIYLIQGRLNSIINTKIVSPRRSGVLVYPFSNANYSSYAAELVNVTVVDGNSSFYDLEVPSFQGAGITNFSLNILDSYFSNYKLNSTRLRISDTNRISLIEFVNPLTTNGANLTDHIRYGLNFAEVKSNLNAGLNSSATITFAGLPTNISNVSVFRNGISCPSNICTNLSNLGPGIYSFSVSGWTNYTINWTGFGTTNTTNNSTNSTNTTIPAGAQSLSIDEPDFNEQYTTASFPVTFVVTLSTINGSVKFSLNNGSTNVTMINDSNGVRFEHVQSSLSAGNYTFIAFANFTNGTRITGRVNFSVTNTTGSSSGTGTGSSGGSGGSGGGGSSSSSGTSTGSTGTIPPFNSSTFGTTTGGTGTTQTLNSQSGSSTAIRSMVYWLLITVLSIMIIILSILIVRAIKDRKKAISSLNSPLSVKSAPQAGGLISNLR